MARSASSRRKAASPDKVTLGGLSAGEARSVDNMESHHFFSHDSETTMPPVSQKFRESKNGLFHFLDDGPFTRREPTTNGRALTQYFRKETRTFGRRARQRHTKTSRNRETRHNAAGGRTQRCGLWRRQCAGGGMPPPPDILLLPKPLSRLTSA